MGDGEGGRGTGQPHARRIAVDSTVGRTSVASPYLREAAREAGPRGGGPVPPPPAPPPPPPSRSLGAGRVELAGINPYRHPPEAPALAGLRDAEIHPRINRP